MPEAADNSVVITTLVSDRFRLAGQLAAKKFELEQLDAKLILCGPGRYASEAGQKLTVVAESKESTGPESYVLPDGEEPHEQARKLAGDAFPSLFSRIVSFVAVKGFPDAAAALVKAKVLTPGKADKLVEIVTVPGKVTKAKAAYVRAS